MSPLFKKSLTLLLAMIVFCQFALAQQAPAAAAPPAAAAGVPTRPPVMKSVFWNTLMGSAWGALMGVAYALQDPKVDFRESVIGFTTLGGMVGYGFGIFLVIRGISFDPRVLPSGATTPFAYNESQFPNTTPDYWTPYPPKDPQDPKNKQFAFKWKTTLFEYKF